MGRFCNNINGSLAASLAGQGDSGLKESEKLPIAQPHLVLGSSNEQTAVSPWTVIGTHFEQSRALMSLAHAAWIAKREGLVGRKWETLAREDQIKGIKVTSAFTAVHSGLTGYFEPDPNEIIIQQDSTVTYKGSYAVPVPPGYTSEEDTTDPLYPLTRVIAGRPTTYYGVNQHAQDSRDMLQVEMDEAMAIAIDSQKGSGWLMTYCTSELVGKALTHMVAGKFNWYQTNHHVGQNHATSFIVKIAGNSCPIMVTNENSDLGNCEVCSVGSEPLGFYPSVHEFNVHENGKEGFCPPLWQSHRNCESRRRHANPMRRCACWHGQGSTPPQRHEVTSQKHAVVCRPSNRPSAGLRSRTPEVHGRRENLETSQNRGSQNEET